MEEQMEQELEREFKRLMDVTLNLEDELESVVNEN